VGTKQFNKKMEFVLPSGDVCLVDEEDYYLFKKYRWSPYIMRGKKRYVVSQNIPNRNNKKVRLHRLILGVNNPKILVDHINGNGFDNRKTNLRLCNCSQNKSNSKKQSINSSGYKGVFVVKRYNKERYVSYIRHNYKLYYLGVFDNKIDAATAYNDGAKKYHGEFARLNDI
jgi:hypothetical protein